MIMTHSFILMCFLTCRNINALEKGEQIVDEDELLDFLNNTEEISFQTTEREKKSTAAFREVDHLDFRILNSILYPRVMKIPISRKGDSEFDKTVCTDLPWDTTQADDPLKLRPTIDATTIKNYPYMVQIMVDEKFRCSGTLITRKHVMTAAKCVVEYIQFESRIGQPRVKKGVIETINTKRLIIRVGSTRLYSGGHTYEVRDVVTHPLYHWSTSILDLSILTLSACVDLSNKVRVAKIHPDCGKITRIEANLRTQAPGWGFHREPTYRSTYVLHVDNEYLYENFACHKIYSFGKHQELTFFPRFCVTACTGMQADDGISFRLNSECQGDVGGPVYYRNKYFIAVVLFRRGCLFPKYPTFSSVVCLDHEWINQETNNLQPDCPSTSLRRVMKSGNASSSKTSELRGNFPTVVPYLVYIITASIFIAMAYYTVFYLPRCVCPKQCCGDTE